MATYHITGTNSFVGFSGKDYPVVDATIESRYHHDCNLSYKSQIKVIPRFRVRLRIVDWEGYRFDEKGGTFRYNGSQTFGPLFVQTIIYFQPSLEVSLTDRFSFSPDKVLSWMCPKIRWEELEPFWTAIDQNRFDEFSWMVLTDRLEELGQSDASKMIRESWELLALSPFTE